MIRLAYCCNNEADLLVSNEGRAIEPKLGLLNPEYFIAIPDSSKALVAIVVSCNWSLWAFNAVCIPSPNAVPIPAISPTTGIV